MAQLRDYHRQKGNTVILVSHSMEEIARNVDRIIVMSHAHKLMDGTPEEIFPGQTSFCRWVWMCPR